MEEKKLIKVGDQAPDLILKDHNGNDVKLSDFKGKRVLLSFHPLAWTSVCAKQMQSLEDNKEIFKELNTIPLGISVDPVPTKTAWAKDLGIEEIRLVSDFWPHGGYAEKLGILRTKEGFSSRSNIILDENHKVAFVKIYETSQFPDIQEIIDFIKSM